LALGTLKLEPENDCELLYKSLSDQRRFVKIEEQRRDEFIRALTRLKN